MKRVKMVMVQNPFPPVALLVSSLYSDLLWKGWTPPVFQVSYGLDRI
jgi:hypothetical protein